ncbi:bifunctional Ribosomal protein L26-L24 [Babesia duncani]|uniref:Bifunctional Ribosomal protein L26-L24 n=1 Tax=Babesia duncani TaxID=323732 RepID=A0AAD9UMZ2_9APIC|nr:bifunctional Ribosomal protein L26-L24 [Babesia duncani]
MARKPSWLHVPFNRHATNSKENLTVDDVTCTTRQLPPNVKSSNTPIVKIEDPFDDSESSHAGESFSNTAMLPLRRSPSSGSKRFKTKFHTSISPIELDFYDPFDTTTEISHSDNGGIPKNEGIIGYSRSETMEFNTIGETLKMKSMESGKELGRKTQSFFKRTFMWVGAFFKNCWRIFINKCSTVCDPQKFRKTGSIGAHQAKYKSRNINIMLRLLSQPSLRSYAFTISFCEPSVLSIAPFNLYNIQSRGAKIVKPRDVIRFWKIRPGDQVVVISGKDKDKVNEVLQCDKLRNQVKVRGCNMRKLMVDGQMVQIEKKIHYSNVQLVDPLLKCGTRVSIKFYDGEPLRVSKKSGYVIPWPKRKPKEEPDLEQGPKDTDPEVALKKTFDYHKDVESMNVLRQTMEKFNMTFN